MSADHHAGRVAVVTGGAGAIGRHAAVGLARAGASVVIADIAADRSEAVVDEIHGFGGQVRSVVVDLATADGVAELGRAALDEFGRVDILVNGVGEHLASAGNFEDSDEAEWDALLAVNLYSVLRTTHLFVPGMKANGWGRIINFSSVEGIRSAPALAVYTASKAAIDGFTKSLGVDLARYGIRVNALAVDKTRAFQVGHYELPPEYEELVHTVIPAGRYGEAADVGEIVLFLASDAASWIVGQTIVADGGTLAAGGWFRTPERWTNQPLMVQYVEDDPAANAARPPSWR
jgi:NAD(P)-dependent dehydrogenase (short-subunit alcohol dehydrogenase family)